MNNKLLYLFCIAAVVYGKVAIGMETCGQLISSFEIPITKEVAHLFPEHTNDTDVWQVVLPQHTSLFCHAYNYVKDCNGICFTCGTDLFILSRKFKTWEQIKESESKSAFFFLDPNSKSLSKTEFDQIVQYLISLGITISLYYDTPIFVPKFNNQLTLEMPLESDWLKIENIFTNTQGRWDIVAGTQELFGTLLQDTGRPMPLRYTTPDGIISYYIHDKITHMLYEVVTNEKGNKAKKSRTDLIKGGGQLQSSYIWDSSLSVLMLPYLIKIAAPLQIEQPTSPLPTSFTFTKDLLMPVSIIAVCATALYWMYNRYYNEPTKDETDNEK